MTEEPPIFCPFCGESDTLIYKDHNEYTTQAYSILCGNCGAQGPIAYQDGLTESETKELAVKMWNMRIA